MLAVLLTRSPYVGTDRPARRSDEVVQGDPQPGPTETASGGRTAVGGAVVATITAVLPMFLLGAVAILVRQELQFDEAALGISASVFFGTTALSAVPAGWTAERVGARRALAIGTLASAGCLAGVALLARSWAGLTAFMVLGGIGNGFAQPAANLAIAQGVSAARQGLAFGVKQSAIPIASLVAGIALPAIALTLGWRWAFGGAAAAALLVSIVAPRIVGSPTAQRSNGRGENDVPLGPMILLAGAMAAGSASALALGAFLVESAVANGVRPGTAGLLLSLGGVTGVCTRLLVGWMADRRDGGHLLVVAAMLVGGAVGFGLLAVSAGRLTFVLLGTVLGFALAWGWPGLMMFAVVRLNPGAPAAASGIAQAGGAAGGVLGPLLFGMIVTQHSYALGWSLAAVVDLLAAGLMVLGRSALLRHREAVAPPHRTVELREGQP